MITDPWSDSTRILRWPIVLAPHSSFPGRRLRGPVDEGTSLANLGRSSTEPLRLPEAEHMIDELDRIMTANGTISIKTPDVWGQDRLAKFRSEYESQMAGWLKVPFKGDINAALRHHEVEATQVQVGANVIQPLPKGSTSTTTVRDGERRCDIPVSECGQTQA